MNGTNGTNGINGVNGSRRQPWSPGRTNSNRDSNQDYNREYNEEPNNDPIHPYLPSQPKSLRGIALRAFALGITLSLSLLTTLLLLTLTNSPLWRLPFFLTALSLFHFLEFYTTATYNTRAAAVSSFLLTSNWPAYAIAHTTALLECLATNLLWPNTSWIPFAGHTGTRFLVTVGLTLVIAGQGVRSAAMVHAAQSFNHTVQYRRQRDHVLVTSGIYSVLRHPSYFGFFWWALGTQLVMGNVLSFAGYAVVLWRFFSGRVRYEERYLVAFFGGEYEEYRRGVGVWIPWVG
ncbi:Isoprenylcysteine carboxyl methyltransferase family-domain-containing protein [Chaetomium sp. MPI-SDFR-AT-0129]|nr:Isoprenylcysteine carboxyl methyltransferase family-domain-containing protein [Chaetomium sp. MPI-SDFR-AT-0129]